MERLILYAWPGNVSSCKMKFRRIVALADPGTILQPAVCPRDSADHAAVTAGSAKPRAGTCGHVDRREAHSRPVTIEREMITIGAARSPRQGGCGRAGARHLTQGTLSEAPAARPLKATIGNVRNVRTVRALRFAASSRISPSIDSSRTRCDPHRVRIVLSRPSRMR